MGEEKEIEHFLIVVGKGRRLAPNVMILREIIGLTG